MKFKKPIAAVLALLMAATVMAACGDRGGAADPAPPPPPPGPGTPAATPAPPPPAAPADLVGDIDILVDPFAAIRAISEQFPILTSNPNPIIPGGELRFAWSSASPFPGLFCQAHSITAFDGDLRQMFFGGDLLTVGMDLNVSNTGSPATAYFDRDAQTVTVRLNEVVYWHDGVQLTLDDLKFAYYVIASPYYTGPRWSVQVWNTVGAAEFRAGEVDYISGLVLSEDKMELVMHKIDLPPHMPAFNFWSSPVPRHHWEGIPVSEMEGHARARHETIGFGPFVLDAIVPGESLRVVANENYWRGRPVLDSIVIEVVEPLMVPMAMQQGMFDITQSFAQSQFTEHFRYMNNVTFLSNPFSTNGKQFLGFRVGTWDTETNEVYTFETPRLSPTLRTAMALTIDHVTAGLLFNGLVVPTGSVYYGLRRIDWIDQSIETFNNFDPERAEAMLDEAGYLRGADGYRTFPDGSELTVVFIATTGTPANELSTALRMQNWDDIGIRVVLYQDRLVEAAVSSDVRFRETDGGIVDVFGFGWNWGASPFPGVFQPNTQNNQVRYRSEHWDYIFNRFNSDDMWDEDFMMETINLWEHAIIDARNSFPTTQAIGLWAVNNRVTNFSLEITGDRTVVSNWATHLWALTAPTAYVDGQ